ncbi:glycosyltransferase family 87 protein [Actibacterium sp. 188UL27-1]|uniref:glycosyltransferase family 87 protein n=1 Tax=Actibacterium sp. 188UL27-1 TaxID=2786961 RepID=UPI00195ED7A0|nr:glycosyltransferase family 87 protein [Actibacterium sp. 188UL27-1]MBM7066501.1 DUF2029 domain-containing protein [Actibacterium sp. 188UL27-1]
MYDVRRQWQLAIILTCFVFYAIFLLFDGARSSDLLATWLAGHFLAEGRIDQIYMTQEPVFTMYAHDSWYSLMQQTFDYHDPLFPFIYPPLWAWLASHLQHISFFTIEPIATAFNLAFIAGMVLLSGRLVGTAVRPVVHVLICLVLLFFTTIGGFAIYENQPQIIVSFLIILAIERARNGSGLVAGAAMALAASIKIYPALLAIVWLATGQRRAFASFVVIGGALGMSSLLTTGWPMHQLFFEQISKVSGSTIINSINWNLNGTIGQIFFRDQMVYLPMAHVDREMAGWYMLAKPQTWIIITKLAPIAVIAVAFPLFAKADADLRDRALWPLLLITMALTAPLGWVYHYMPVVVLLTGLVSLMGRRDGYSVIVTFISVLGFPALLLYGWLGFGQLDVQLIGTGTITLLAVVFAVQVKTHLSLQHSSPLKSLRA